MMGNAAVNRWKADLDLPDKDVIIRSHYGKREPWPESRRQREYEFFSRTQMIEVPWVDKEDENLSLIFRKNT